MHKPCPDCGSPIGVNVYRCRCGWMATNITKGPEVDCHFAPGCGRPARMRTDRFGVNGQITPLCYDCADRLQMQSAEKFCKEKGLDTTEQRIAYCRAMSKKFAARVSSLDREPGQDDEERLAA